MKYGHLKVLTWNYLTPGKNVDTIHTYGASEKYQVCPKLAI